jgi:hypothetical protein
VFVDAIELSDTNRRAVRIRGRADAIEHTTMLMDAQPDAPEMPKTGTGVKDGSRTVR